MVKLESAECSVPVGNKWDAGIMYVLVLEL